MSGPRAIRKSLVLAWALLFSGHVHGGYLRCDTTFSRSTKASVPRLRQVPTVGKPCDCSSIYNAAHKCHFGNDGLIAMGNSYDFYASSHHTKRYEWWLVDLEEPFRIDLVVVTDRTNNHHDKFRERELRIGNEDPRPLGKQQIEVNQVCDHPKSNRDNEYMLAYFYYCQPTLEGQYVTLQQLVDEVHSLNEIFIFTQVQDVIDLFYESRRLPEDRAARCVSESEKLTDVNAVEFHQTNLTCSLGHVPQEFVVDPSLVVAGTDNATVMTCHLPFQVPGFEETLALLHPDLLLYAPLNWMWGTPAMHTDDLHPIHPLEKHTYENGVSLFSQHQSIKLHFRLRYDFPEVVELKDVSAFTWFNSIGAIGGDQLIFHLKKSQNNGVLFFTSLEAADLPRKLALAMWSPSGPMIARGTDTAEIIESIWVHVGFTYNALTGVVKFYINGEQNGPDVQVNPVAAPMVVNKAHLGFSRFDTGFGKQWLCIGCTLTELEIYSRVVSNEEVRKSYLRLFGE